MTITKELDLDSFEPWSGAVDTLDRIKREGKTRDLEFILEELYPDGMTETELNDLLWFDDETVLHEWLGLDTYDSIQEELEEKERELEVALNERQEVLEDEELTEEEKTETSEGFVDIIEGLQAEIEELEERLKEL